MKKIATLLLAAGLVFGAATGASAIDFKAKGEWIMSFDYGMNGDFQGKYNGHTKTGSHYANRPDDFEASQRVRLSLDAVASESLSGNVFFELGEQIWGKAATSRGGAALGADGTGSIKLRRAYIDWMVPETDLKVRMGLQGVTLPSYTIGGSSVLNDDVAGITASYKVNDMVTISALWARPYNDNFTGTTWNGQTDRSGYMDNLDAFALLVPLTFDGVKVTPWGMYAAIGPNTFRNSVNGKNYLDPSWSATSSNNSIAGLFPMGGARHKNFRNANDVESRHLTSYGNAWWAGLTGEVTLLDPLRIAWDFNYGSVTWEDDGRLNRQGWLASLLVEYKLDWAIPGLYGWYGSGDDNNPSNGSERLPVISGGNGTNDFSHFAFKGDPYIARDGVIGGGNDNMAGTWGVGARLKDMSFIEDLKHTFRVNFMGGTNSKSMAKKLSERGYWANGNDIEDGGALLASQGMYLTTGDTALELGLTNTYKMYENFTIQLEADYIAMWLDTSKSAWGARHKKGEPIPQTKDAWNINASFVYSF